MTVQPAGDFSFWLDQLQAALRGAAASDVPCGSCTACCTSSQFVHIGPNETETIRHIPPALLFRAPGLARGHLLLGYDEHGHCPMLINNRCSIYDHRPRTCRTYDCRVFPAAGVELVEPSKSAIVQQARRWRFSYPTPQARDRHDAVRAATAFLLQHASVFATGELPRDQTQLAVLAIDIHELFLGAADARDPLAVRDAVRQIIAKPVATG